MKAISGMNPKSNLLEIGCNDGSFLASLNEDGINKCIGIEPSKDAFLLAKGKGFAYTNGEIACEADMLITIPDILEQYLPNKEKE